MKVAGDKSLDFFENRACVADFLELLRVSCGATLSSLATNAVSESMEGACLL